LTAVRAPYTSERSIFTVKDNGKFQKIFASLFQPNRFDLQLPKTSSYPWKTFVKGNAPSNSLTGPGSASVEPDWKHFCGGSHSVACAEIFEVIK